MIDALKKLQMAQILTQALSGPTGWATLGIGLGVAAGATAGVIAYNKSQEKTTKVTIENKTYIDSWQVSRSVRRDIILDQNRNTTSGVK
jgi:hypothetical protein